MVLASPTLFNVAVDNMVCHLRSLIVEDNSATHYVLGMVVGRSMGVIYADDRIIRSRELEWIQGVINVLFGIFIRVVLMYNVSKSNTVSCQLGAIITGMLEEASSHSGIGERDMYWEHLCRSTPCPNCRVELTSGSMTAHRIRVHRTDPAIEWYRLPVIHTEHLTIVY